MTGRPSWLLAALVLALAPTVGLAQPRSTAKPQTVPPDGTEVFRWLLHTRKIEPLSEAELANRLDLNDVIVIVLGEDTHLVNRMWPTRWASVVTIDHGGAALVASDDGLDLGGFSAVARPFGVNGDSVTASEPGTSFRNKVTCPFVAPFEPPDRAGPEWKLFDGLDRVATNQPSYLTLPTRTGWGISPIAGYPPGCRNPFAERVGTPRTPFAVGATDPAGRRSYRLLVMADPSVFINLMLVESPDNLTLARRTVEYLQDPQGVDRKKCLFIQNGAVVTRFDSLKSVLGEQPPPIPLPSLDKLQEKLVDVGNRVVDHVQENDLPARAGRYLVDALFRNGVGSILLWIVLILFKIYLLKRVWGRRVPTDVPPAPPGGRPVPTRGETPAGVFDRRQRELLRRNNLYEPVRAVVRDLFTAAGAPAGAGPGLPRVVVAAVVRRPDTLRDALADLWKIAFGPPKIVTVQRWTLLEPLVERVRRAHADGKWRFAAAGPGTPATGAKGSEA